LYNNDVVSQKLLILPILSATPHPPVKKALNNQYVAIPPIDNRAAEKDRPAATGSAQMYKTTLCRLHKTGQKTESGCWLVLLERIELSTSPLPMVCSTTELQQHVAGAIRWMVASGKCQHGETAIFRVR
jgi:hypothetical protein